METHELQKIFESIKTWKILIDDFLTTQDIVKGEKILNLLNQGNFFKTTYEEVAAWKTSLEQEPDEEKRAIHVYVGIVDEKLKIYLIDSVNDKAGNFDNTITVKDFHREIPTESVGEKLRAFMDALGDGLTQPVPINQVAFRNFKWNIYCGEWLRNKGGNNGTLFQVIRIPFKDYTSFNLEPGQCCFNFFGLREMISGQPASEEIEILVIKGSTLGDMGEFGKNYSTPRPPFSITDPVDDYQLLISSGGV